MLYVETLVYVMSTLEADSVGPWVTRTPFTVCLKQTTVPLQSYSLPLHKIISDVILRGSLSIIEKSGSRGSSLPFRRTTSRL